MAQRHVIVMGWRPDAVRIASAPEQGRHRPRVDPVAPTVGLKAARQRLQSSPQHGVAAASPSDCDRRIVDPVHEIVMWRTAASTARSVLNRTRLSQPASGAAAWPPGRSGSPLQGGIRGAAALFTPEGGRRSSPRAGATDLAFEDLIGSPSFTGSEVIVMSRHGSRGRPLRTPSQHEVARSRPEPNRFARQLFAGLSRATTCWRSCCPSDRTVAGGRPWSMRWSPGRPESGARRRDRHRGCRPGPGRPYRRAGGRGRPHRGDAAHRPASESRRAGAAHRIALAAGRAEQLPFADALVRRAHVHLSAAVRRRSRPPPSRSWPGSSGRAGSWPAWSSVSRRTGCGGRGMAPLHAGRAAGRGLCGAASGLGPGRVLPGPVHRAALPHATPCSGTSRCGRRPVLRTSGCSPMSLGGGLVMSGRRSHD